MGSGLSQRGAEATQLSPPSPPQAAASGASPWASVDLSTVAQLSEKHTGKWLQAVLGEAEHPIWGGSGLHPHRARRLLAEL